MNASIYVESDGQRLDLSEWLAAAERRRAKLHIELGKTIASAVIRLSKSIESRALVAKIPDINGISTWVKIERTAHTLGIRKGRNGVYSWQPLLRGHWDKSIRPIYNVHGLKNCDGGGIWSIKFLHMKKYDLCLNTGDIYYVAAESTVGALNVARRLIVNYARGLCGLARRTFHRAQVKLAQASNAGSASGGSDKKLSRRSNAIADAESNAAFAVQPNSVRVHYGNGLDYAAEDIPELQSAIDAATRSMIGEVDRKLGLLVDGEEK